MLRLPLEKDYPEIIRMAEAFHSVSPYSNLTFSQAGCRTLFDHFMNGDKTDVMIILAVDDKDIPFGMIIGTAGTAVFAKEKLSQELAWWVDETYRGSKDSILLKKAYEDWSLRIGCKITQMAMLDEVTNLDKFYRRSGFVPAERSYIKER